MATTRYQSNDLRRQVGSPRPKGRGSSARNLSTWRDGSSGVANVPDAQENKDTLCRNVLIYGNCRYEDQGCTFSHDQNKGKANQSQSDRCVHVFLDSLGTATRIRGGIYLPMHPLNVRIVYHPSLRCNPKRAHRATHCRTLWFVGRSGLPPACCCPCPIGSIA
jgi:hypothetical protein